MVYEKGEVTCVVQTGQASDPVRKRLGVHQGLELNQRWKRVVL